MCAGVRKTRADFVDGQGPPNRALPVQSNRLPAGLSFAMRWLVHKMHYRHVRNAAGRRLFRCQGKMLDRWLAVFGGRSGRGSPLQ